MSNEVIWLTMPIVGILSQIGGTFLKQVRRIGIPTLMIVIALLFYGFNWLLIPTWLLIFGATTLPFTLKGDSIHEHWINWVWIPIWATLLTYSGILFSVIYGGITTFLFASILPVVVISTTCILSNVKVTAKYFPWKFCEAVTYMAAMYPSLLILTIGGAL